MVPLTLAKCLLLSPILCVFGIALCMAPIAKIDDSYAVKILCDDLTRESDGYEWISTQTGFICYNDHFTSVDVTTGWDCSPFCGASERETGRYNYDDNLNLNLWYILSWISSVPLIIGVIVVAFSLYKWSDTLSARYMISIVFLSCVVSLTIQISSFVIFNQTFGDGQFCWDVIETDFECSPPFNPDDDISFEYAFGIKFFMAVMTIITLTTSICLCRCYWAKKDHNITKQIENDQDEKSQDDTVIDDVNIELITVIQGDGETIEGVPNKF